MATSTIRKQVPGFCAAHVATQYHGDCRFLHGHNYEVLVEVTGEIIEDTNSPYHGMVIDFGEIKRVYKEEVHSQLDHSLILGHIWPGWYKSLWQFHLDRAYKGDVPAFLDIRDRMGGRWRTKHRENLLDSPFHTALSKVDSEIGKVAHLDIAGSTGECIAEWIHRTMQHALLDYEPNPSIIVTEVVVTETPSSLIISSIGGL